MANSHSHLQHGDAVSRVRTRINGVIQAGPFHHRMTYKPPTLPFDQVYPAKQFVSDEYMHDYVTRRYQQVVSDGWIVNRPMWHVTTSYAGVGDTGFSLKFLDSGFLREWTIDRDVAASYLWTPGPVGLNQIDQENLINLARTAALAGVQAPTLQSMVSMGELVKTLKMLLSPTRALSKIFQQSAKDYARDLRRYGNRLNQVMKYRTWKGRQKALSQLKRGEKVPKLRDVTDLEFIPDMVLVYNLGWKPLMMDLDALLNKIPALEDEARRTSRSEKSARAQWSETKTLSHSSGNKGVFRDDITEVCTVRAGCIYADNFSTSQHFGTRLVDVPETIWELITFSFVVDYAVNVEKYLGALRATLSQQILTYFTKVTIETSVTRTWVDFLPATPWILNGSKPAGSTTVTYRAVSRIPERFTGSLAYVPFNLSVRPAAQAQNVLSLLTKLLFEIRAPRAM